jgi:hypothetical protein
MGEGRGHQGTSCRLPGSAPIAVSPSSCACSPQPMQRSSGVLETQSGTSGHALQVLMAWSAERVVISFRGTASWQNVLADLQFWLTGAQPPGALLCVPFCVFFSGAAAVVRPAILYALNAVAHISVCCLPCPAPGRAFGVCACAGHPPIRGRGNWLCGTRPHVHAGFLRSWQANGLNQKLLERIKGIVGAATPKGKLPRQTVYVTGDAASRRVLREQAIPPAFLCARSACALRATLASTPKQVTAWAAAWRCWRPTTSPRGCRR